MILSNEFLPVWGGIGTYVVELAQNLPKDLEIHIVAPNRTGFAFGEKNTFQTTSSSFSKNIHVHYLGAAQDTFLYNFNFQVNCLRAVPSLIKKFNIDIIHSQSTMPDLLLALKKNRVPIVTTIHNTIGDQVVAIRSSERPFTELAYSEKMVLSLNSVLNVIEKQYYTNQRHYISISNWMKNNIIEKYKRLNESQVNIIPNGVDSNKFNPSKRNEAKKLFPKISDINSLKILYFSRFVESKGIKFLSRSIPSILKKNDAHFIFAGTGKQFSLNLPNDNFSMLGYIPHALAPYVYSLADIFVLPSLYENMPLSLLEAMSTELAVISTNVGGIPEIIKANENGLLISPKSVNDIIVSLNLLIDDTNYRKQLARNARKTAENDFNWEKTALLTKKLYNAITYGHTHN